MPLTGTFSPLPLLKRNGDSYLRCLRVAVTADRVEKERPCVAEIRHGGFVRKFNLGDLDPGPNEKRILIPEPEEELTAEAVLLYGEERWSGTFRLPPARRWTVHLVLHSHTDLGFTDPLSTVARIHNENTDRAIRLCRETASWPEGTRFKWTCEVSWQVQQYLAARHPDSVEALMKLIQGGSIAVGALYAGELTDILGHEEAVRSLYYAAYLRRRFGIPCDTAMLCDVPGCTAGFIQVMAKAGITNFILADNNFIAPILVRTDLPRPFWWKGADNTQVLCWYTDHPFYAYIEGEYYGLTRDVETVARKLPEKLIALERAGYPFNSLQLQYAFDNATLDERPLEIVRAWNATWEYPKVLLSTAREFLNHLRSTHAGQIPARAGDWTNWWAGIVTGFPVETSLSRSGHERAPAMELIWAGAALHDRSLDYPERDITRVYDGLLAFDEHSGGGAVWNPKNDEEQQQAIREGYGQIHNALAILEGLESGAAAAIGTMIRNDSTEDLLALLNPTGLVRSGIVEIPMKGDGDSVSLVDQSAGNIIGAKPSSGGNLVFRATDIPPYGYRTYRLSAADMPTVAPAPGAMVRRDQDAIVLENRLYRLVIDQQTGSCSSLFSIAAQRECARYPGPVNQPFVYVSHPVTKIELGKYIPEIYTGVENPGEILPWPSASLVELELDDHPVLGASCRVTHTIEGQPWLRQEYRLPHEDPGVFMSNTLYRAVREDQRLASSLAGFLGGEGLLYFSFPFEVPGGEFEYESPGGVIRPSTMQFKGSCHDFFAVQRWCRIANPVLSLALVSPDAPLVDVGSVGLLKFKPGLDLDQSSLYFRAVTLQEWGRDHESPYSRDKDLEFRFGIHVTPTLPGAGAFDGRSEAHAFGLAMHAPINIMHVPPNPRGILPSTRHSWCSLSPANVEIMTLKEAEDRSGVIIRLREVLGEPADARVRFPGFRVASAWSTMITEERLETADVRNNTIHLRLSPFAMQTFLVVLEADEEGVRDD